MRRCGVRDDRPVVVCDDWSGLAAARAWWLLRFHGHADVRLLDGAWAAWTAAGAPVETGSSTPGTGDLTVRPGTAPHVDAPQVPAVAVLVDARAPERFRGEVEPIDPVAGHIPGAVNRPATLLLDEQARFRPSAEIAAAYAGLDAPVLYCGSGVTAAQALLALESAGVVGGRIYPGSWSDWIRDPARPVATGEEPDGG